MWCFAKQLVKAQALYAVICAVGQTAHIEEMWYNCQVKAEADFSLLPSHWGNQSGCM